MINFNDSLILLSITTRSFERDNRCLILKEIGDQVSGGEGRSLFDLKE
ncbi:MAG: hypothetical protein M1G31_05110 [Pseudanabaena sp. Salubria-1]|nr:hypothetical protein [Pseudanabaena sp. Salubria-1]